MRTSDTRMVSVLIFAVLTMQLQFDALAAQEDEKPHDTVSHKPYIDFVFQSEYSGKTAPPENILGGQQSKLPQPDIQQTYLLLPVTFPTGYEHRFDFRRLMAEGEFALLKGPGKISSEGVFSWRAGNGHHGTTQSIEFKVTRNTQVTTYKIDFRVSRNGITAVRSSNTGPLAKSKARFVWFPVSIQPDQLFEYDLARKLGEGKYLLLDGPGHLTRHGQFSWTPRNIKIPVHELIFQKIDSSGKLKYFYIKLLVERGYRQFHTTFGQVQEVNELVHVENQDIYRVLECPSPNDWVLAADGETLIVSFAKTAELAYFDTTKEIVLKRVKLEFQPNFLARQGDTLYASSIGSSVVHVLNCESGELEKKILLNAGAITGLTCRPRGGFLFASTEDYDVFVIDANNTTATKTTARGHHLALDPRAGKFLFTGIQSNRNSNDLTGKLFSLAKEFERNGQAEQSKLLSDLATQFRQSNTNSRDVYNDRRGTRAAIFKYKIVEKELELIDVQRNAAIGGRSLSINPDGESIVFHGDSWYPMHDGIGGGSFTAIWDTKNLQSRVGQIPSSQTCYHPILNLAARNLGGWQVQVFRTDSLVTKPTLVVNERQKGTRQSPLFTFAGKGKKIAFWNGNHFAMRQGLTFLPLELDDQQITKLQEFYD